MAILWLVQRSTSLVILLICVESFPIWCQTNRVQSQLNAVYKGKILLLRNFYAGSDLEYDQNGTVLKGSISGSWTLADVEIKGVTVTSQGIEIVGNRLGTLYNKEKPGYIKVGKLRIHVAKLVSDVDSDATLNAIFSRIFIELGEDLRPMLPDCWAYYLEGTDSPSRLAAWKASLEKRKVVTIRPADAPPGKIAPPHLVDSPDPKYTKEARLHLIEGLSVLRTVIDVTGTPGNIAIVQPLGMGLDEQAVLALEQWKFQPATLNGAPVPAQIEIQMNFRCCP